MSEEIAISVQNLTKIYKLYNSPQDRLKESLHPLRKKFHKDFYALNDVSFEIQKGETVGIVGKNGSGKSTLLKLITGVLTPNSGSVAVAGKVSALLELGAGFNPQLTGIENVYFNGTIMGYTHEQMEAKLDDILSFADIGDFVHQPVKTYSSGMFVRLAFAVAINIDPEILIVDEALAVGDAIFQKKCMDKIHDFKNQGKTILMVSHSSEHIKSFAQRGIVLDSGCVHFDGASERAITEYLKLIFPQKNLAKAASPAPATLPAASAGESDDPSLAIVPSPESLDRAYGAGGAEITKIDVFNLERPNLFNGNDSLRFRISYSWDPDFLLQLIQQHELDANILFGMSIETLKGIELSAFSTSFAGSGDVDVDPSEASSCTFEFTVHMPELAGGDYFLTLGLSLGRQEKHIPLRRYRNIVHLKCVQRRKYIFGLMTLPLEIKKITQRG